MQQSKSIKKPFATGSSAKRVSVTCSRHAASPPCFCLKRFKSVCEIQVLIQMTEVKEGLLVVLSWALFYRSKWLLITVGFTGNLQSMKDSYWTGSSPCKGPGCPCEEGISCCIMLAQCHICAHVGQAD